MAGSMFAWARRRYFNHKLTVTFSSFFFFCYNFVAILEENSFSRYLETFFKNKSFCSELFFLNHYVDS